MQPVTLALCVAWLYAQSQCQTPSTGLRHPSLAMLGVWASADYFKCPRCFGDGLHLPAAACYTGPVRRLAGGASVQRVCPRNTIG